MLKTTPETLPLPGGTLCFADGCTVLCGYADSLSLADTLDCGQAFRWRRGADGHFRGMAGARFLECYPADGDIVLCCNEAAFRDFWYDYFDLGRDYAALRRSLCADTTLAAAVAYAPAIRVLRQLPWEALLTFILSANNNIARIKGLVARLCEAFGGETEYGFAFPTAERLAALSLADLAPLRAGYRDAYILDCAQRVAAGALDLDAVAKLPTGEARQALMQVKGVGPKVADCALLFGFGKTDCFPRDVWMNRAMAQLFPAGLPDCARGCAGIAQQYIFHYVRTSGVLNGEDSSPLRGPE